jgi:hypothetical protein
MSRPQARGLVGPILKPHVPPFFGWGMICRRFAAQSGRGFGHDISLHSDIRVSLFRTHPVTDRACSCLIRPFQQPADQAADFRPPGVPSLSLRRNHAKNIPDRIALTMR